MILLSGVKALSSFSRISKLSESDRREGMFFRFLRIFRSSLEESNTLRSAGSYTDMELSGTKLQVFRSLVLNRNQYPEPPAISAKAIIRDKTIFLTNETFGEN